MKCSRSYKQLLMSTAAACVLMVTQLSPGIAQVEGAMAVAGLAQALISAGDNSGNPQLTAILAQTRMIEALHSRLDQVEMTLSLIMRQLANIKEDVRAELNRDRDQQRSETVYGKVQIIQKLIERLANATAKDQAKIRSQLETRLLNLQEERSSLMRRSDFVLPTLISAMVAEISAMEAIGRSTSADFADVLAAYDERISDMQRDGREAGLVRLKISLEQQQQALATKLASLVVDDKATQLISGEYLWFKHGLTRDRTVKYWSSCVENNVGRGMRLPCEKSKTVTDNLHWREWRREVSFEAIEDGSAANVYRLKITPMLAAIGEGAVPGAKLHNAADDSFEAEYFEKEKSIESLVATFNSQAAAIVELQRLEALASSARGLIARWARDDARSLVTRARSLEERPRNALDKLDRRLVEEQIAQREKAMADARAAAWQVVAEARRDVSEALDRATRESWRSEIVASLGILRASLATYLTVEKSLTVKTEESARADGKQNTRGASRRPDKNRTASTVSRPEVERTATSGGPLSKMARIERVQQIISEVKAHPVKEWGTLPPGVTNEEIKLVEAIAHLDTLRPTPGDKLVSDQRTRGVDAASEMTISFAKEGVAGAGWTGIKHAVKPTAAADGTLLGEAHRNALRGVVNELLHSYVRQRFISGIQDNPASSARYVDPCVAAHACLRAR